MPDTPTERDGLDLKIRSTIQFNFGMLCDKVSDLIGHALIDEKAGEALIKQIRREGNNAISVIANHLDYVNVSRNHTAEKINPRRIANAFKEQEKG